MISKSLLKEFVNQADLKKSDASDAGKNDVKPVNDVNFSLMRNAINSDGQVSGSDVANYLEKAHKLNDEVETVLYGLETDDGKVVKVYVGVTDADKFEVEMKKMLGMQDDIEEAINQLAMKFDIVDVVWPKEDGEVEDSDEEDDLDLDSETNMGGADEDDNDMEVIASSEPTDDEPSEEEPSDDEEEEPSDEEEEPSNDEEEEPSDDEEEELKPKKKADSDKLKTLGKNMKMKEGKLQPGWYVTDKNDKTIAGPVEEAEAKRICKEKGGDAKGFITVNISDYDARRANETQGDNMTIGNKFLKRVLAEQTIAEAAKEDNDGIMDGFDIPLDAQQRVLAAEMKGKLPKQIIALFSMIGIPGIKLKSAGAYETVDEASQMLRTNASVRRAFVDFYKAYATASGLAIEKEPMTEAKMKRGNYLQKMLETVLVELGLPESLVVTTGPGMVGTALFRASKMIEDSADLKMKLRMLAIRMGIKPSDAMSPFDDKAVVEAMGQDPAAKKIFDKIKGTPNLKMGSLEKMVASYLGMVSKTEEHLPMLTAEVATMLQKAGLMEVAAARTDMAGNVNLGQNQDAKAVAMLLNALGLNNLISAMDSMAEKRNGGYKLPDANMRPAVIALARKLMAAKPAAEPTTAPTQPAK